MDEIIKKLERLRWRLEKVAEKRHPFTEAQREEIRNALAARLEKSQPKEKQAEQPKDQPVKSQEKTKAQDKGMSHGQ